MRMTTGDKLTTEDKKHVLAAYVHRHTGEHRPCWAHDNNPVQFANDAEWLRNTRFAVRADGRLDRRVRRCESSPTWPNNPELRKA